MCVMDIDEEIFHLISCGHHHRTCVAENIIYLGIHASPCNDTHIATVLSTHDC